MNRKAIFISLGVLALIVMGAIAYTIFQKKTDDETSVINLVSSL